MLHKTNLPAKVSLSEKKEDGLARVTINGYTGDSVNLSDYGIDDPVVYKMEGIKLNKENVPYLLNHSPFHPLGHIETVANNENLMATAVHSFPSQESKDVATAIENGMPYEASMGLEINVDSVTFHSEGAVEVNGRTFNAPIYVVGESTLVELSATLFGRDGNTSVTKLSKETLMTIKNKKPEDATPVVVPAVVELAAPVAPVVPVALPVDNRLEKLMDWMVEYKDHPELIKNGMKDGWDDDRMKREVEIKVIQNGYPGVPSVFVPSTKVENGFTAHYALSCGLSPEFLEKKLGKAAVDNAVDKPRMGLKESLMYAANANGGNFNGHSDTHNLMKFIKRLHINNAFSTVDYPNLMHQVAKWTMESAWLLDPPFAPSICNPVSNKDFRPTGHIKPRGGKMWNGLSQEGKIEHASFGKEDRYMTELGTIAQLLILKREDVVNDDIGWIEQTLLLMKEGAWMYPDFQLVNLIYNSVTAGVLDNGSGAYTLAFNAANLETLFNFVKRRPVVKGGLIVNAQRQTKWKLVFASGLEKAVWEVINQDRFVQGASGVLTGERNYWKDKFELVMFDQLDNTTYNANAKAGAWGLVPTSTQFSPFAITYLNGQKMPTTEVVDLPADELGFGVRGYFDVNVDYRPVENNKLQATAWSFPV